MNGYLQTYAIDALTLHREFETSVVRYREAVDTNETARTNFEKMYSHYGQVAFTGELLEPRALFGPYSFSQYHRFEHEMR